MEENDSLDDDGAYGGRAAAIAHGLAIGASHAFICMDQGGALEAAYAIDECPGRLEKALWRVSYSVETIDLDEIRKANALA